MADGQIIQADLTLLGTHFKPGVQIEVADGRIERVGALGLEPTHRLCGEALLPGMINAHSHAFQRALRGRAEVFPQTSSDFWVWRDEMYRLVESLDGPAFVRVSKQAFVEMLAAGVTTVGEFHYLHHDASGCGFAFDELLLQAAREAGIRLVLLQVYYHSGGIGKPLAGGQLRFATRCLNEFWKQFEKLEARLDPNTQSLGVAAHSVRAVPLADLAALAAGARDRGICMHMHVEEQPAEIEACKTHYGQMPMELVLEHVQPQRFFTAVHCTHSKSKVLRSYVAAGGRVCICPTTEANLGDGLADVRAIRDGGGAICLGSDSNARIDMIEEMRWLEYGQRLRLRTRGVVVGEDGRVASGLWDCATTHGAAALRVKAGKIENGYLADFFTIDLGASSLQGHTPENLLDVLIFGAPTPAAKRVCVGGVWGAIA